MARAVERSDYEVYRLAAIKLDEHISHSTIQELLRFVALHSATAFVCAGAVRDSLYSVLTNRPIRPRDIDVGICGLSRAAFLGLSSVLDVVANKYGGYSIRFGRDINGDVWRLEDTVGTKTKRYPSTISNVLRSFVLDVNAVAYEPSTRSFCDEGALTALRRRVIGIVPTALIHSESEFAARATLLAKRLSFRLTDDLDLLVLGYLRQAELTHQLRKHHVNEVQVESEAQHLLKLFKSGQRGAQNA